MKTKILNLRAGIFGATSFLLANLASGQVLFSDDFDSIGSPITATASGLFSGYNVNMASTDNRVIFGYDYSVANLGIPSAPNSTGGSQIGVRMDANRTLGVISSLTISPTTTFAGNFSIRFDMWLNSIGPFPAGGTSSSENLTAGVGYNGTTFQNASSGSGVWFSVTGDGGFSGTSLTPDYQARIGSTLVPTNTAGVYAAGTAGGASSSSDNSNPYYTSRFPGQTPPSAQTTAFPASQTGTAAAGSMLFKWHDVQIDRVGNVVTWMIDGNLIATVNNAAATATDAIDIGFWDPGASSATSGLVFAIIDNLTVTQVPEPSTAGLLIVGASTLLISRRRGKVPN
jgi:hypothetical protein